MQKTFLTSMAVFGLAALCNAANANISANAESASCDNSTIGASSGTTTLEAQWQANTINISWYDGDNAITPTNEAAGECTYDNPLVLPSNVLSRNGYTFDGWTVKSAPSCRAAIPDLSLNGTAYGYSTLDGTAGSNEATYGLTQGSGEWATAFSYGTVKGVASCNSISSTSTFATGPYIYNDDARPATDMNSNSTGVHCWCRLTEANGVACSVSESLWVHLVNMQDMYADAAFCAKQCAQVCANTLRQNSDFRSAMFGQ